MKVYLIVFLFTFMPLTAQSAAPKWDIITKESQLIFTATQNGAPIIGQFKTFSGNVLVDPKDLKNSSIAITIDINSIQASYPEIKDTLITADWFNSEHFPKAEFRSNQIEKTAENTYQAKGKLTIRNKSVPIRLNFTGEQPSDAKGVVKGSVIIKRSDFGIGQGQWASTNEIKDEVRVDFTVIAEKD